MATPSDRDYYIQLAKDQLQNAQMSRQHYDDLLQAAITAHGDVADTPTSGVYNPAFPEHIKTELRTYAHNIGVQVENAYALWRKAGRRAHTLRPFADKARELKDGRTSYY